MKAIRSILFIENQYEARYVAEIKRLTERNRIRFRR